MGNKIELEKKASEEVASPALTNDNKTNLTQKDNGVRVVGREGGRVGGRDMVKP